MKTVVTITGIRPDFIRMSEIFRKLDIRTNHILIHSGQHYDRLLSDVFFEGLKIRHPDYNLEVGGPGKEHFHISSEIPIKVINLFRKNGVRPDIILFLGDSNSVMAAPALRKEGYRIGHIEAGMRSHDKRMLEEINRVVCDHSSNYLFVYHEDYKQNCIKENISEKDVYVVGNTIVEVCDKMLKKQFIQNKKNKHVLLDIHRPENFKHVNRLSNIIDFANHASVCAKAPVNMIGFPRTMKYIKEYGIDIGKINIVDMMSYSDFLDFQYNSVFMISDSGTAQEEAPLLRTPVIVPRDFTERPQSMSNNCSIMVDMNSKNDSWDNSIQWAKSDPDMCLSWLGEGCASEKIVSIIEDQL